MNLLIRTPTFYETLASKPIQETNNPHKCKTNIGNFKTKPYHSSDPSDKKQIKKTKTLFHFTWFQKQLREKTHESNHMNLQIRTPILYETFASNPFKKQENHFNTRINAQATPKQNPSLVIPLKKD